MKETHLFVDTGAPSSSDGVFTLNSTHKRLCLTILSISTGRKKNPPLWCRLVYCLLYSSLLILQTRCFLFFFFNGKYSLVRFLKVVLKANKPFLKKVRVVPHFTAVNKKPFTILLFIK